MMTKILCTISFFLLSFENTISQKVVDLADWRHDSMGCNGYRNAMRTEIKRQLDSILRLHGGEFLLRELGPPNILRKMGKRKVLYYYIDCNNIFPDHLNLEAAKNESLQIPAIVIHISRKRKVISIANL